MRTLSRLALAFGGALAILVLAPDVHGQAGTPADVIARAAEALGGRNRVMAANTLTIEGYGQLAYQNGGGNITSSPDAPQKWVDINEHRREIDLRTGRMLVRQKQVNGFVFAAEQGMRGGLSQQGVEGDVAFNLAGTGAAATVTRAPAAAARTRRMDMLAHPLTAVRAALDPAATVSNARREGTLELVDITARLGDLMTLAVDASGLPVWVRWTAADPNLGNVTFRAAFTGYQPVSGLRLPTGFNTTIDFRNIVQSKLYVDRQAVNAPLTAITLPDTLRKDPPPVPAAPVIEATAVAKGIWYLRGQGNSTLFEFSDHLTLFEAYGSEANALAIIAKARSLVPGKPLTQVIVSHHHFDHTGGLRAAVAEGLTIVTQAGNEALFRELATRPARLFPDALGRAPKPIRIQILTVDDQLKMKDASMEIDIYRVVANSHMADGLLVHVPGERLLVQGDLFDVSWEIYWWGSSYEDNIRYRKLQVERDLPVHGRIAPIAEVQALIKKQIAAAQALCASVDAARLTMPGCPVKETVDR